VDCPFLKEDDVTSVVACIAEVDGVTEHAIAIWQGEIYNLYQAYVMAQSHAAFYDLCINTFFSIARAISAKVHENAGFAQKKEN
jgi:hypothetical protein